MKNSTLDALAQFSRNEKKYADQVLRPADRDPELAPSDQTIRNILNYSKALSVRRSDSVDHVFVVLN